MAFAQLTCRESLRDIESCLRAVPAKLYHLGIRGTVSRTTLAYANEQRDWRVFAGFAQLLIAEARGTLWQGHNCCRPHADALRVGFYDHRPLLGTFPVGKVPQDKGGCKTAYAGRLARFYSDVHPHNRRENPRCQRSGLDHSRARCLLHHGPGLPGS